MHVTGVFQSVNGSPRHDAYNGFTRHQPLFMSIAHLIIGQAQVEFSLSATPLGIERDLIWYLKRSHVILMVERR